MEPIHPKYTRICCKIFDLVELQIKYLYRERKKESPPPRLLQTQKRKKEQTHLFFSEVPLSPIQFQHSTEAMFPTFQSRKPIQKGPKVQAIKTRQNYIHIVCDLKSFSKKRQCKPSDYQVGWLVQYRVCIILHCIAIHHPISRQLRRVQPSVVNGAGNSGQGTVSKEEQKSLHQWQWIGTNNHSLTHIKVKDRDLLDVLTC